MTYFSGRINWYNMGLGIVLLLCVAVLWFIYGRYNFYNEVTIAATLVGLPVAIGLLYNGLRYGRTTITLSDVQIVVNDDGLAWNDLTQVTERAIARYWLFLRREILVKQLRQLELYSPARDYPLLISDEWLTDEAYTAVRHQISRHHPIHTKTETYKG